MKTFERKGELASFGNYCENCQSAKVSTNQEFLEAEEQKYLLFSECHGCGLRTLMLIHKGKVAMNAFGVLTELNQEELRTIAKKDGISVDDVIAIHEVKDKNKPKTVKKASVIRK